MSSNVSWLEKQWYQPKSWQKLFLPFHWLLCALVKLRRWLYVYSVFKQTTFPCKVIVVGNINVGGTGKTPLILALLDYATKKGGKVGVVSRGYGGSAVDFPYVVGTHDDSSLVGDEPALIKNNFDIPVVIDPVRTRGVKKLVEMGCTTVISDDGLQHYKMARDIEMVVIDGRRRFGNRMLMPFGPLREPVGRLKSVDYCVYNNTTKGDTDFLRSNEQASFHLVGFEFVNLFTNETKSLEQFKKQFSKQPVTAIAGIGYPQRFSLSLDEIGVEHSFVAFPDHHQFQSSDFDSFENDVVIMTEKDAVKVSNFAKENFWFLRVKPEINEPLKWIFEQLINDSDLN